jgi:hypothetical protein
MRRRRRDTTTVAQLSIGLPCGALYRPSKTEIDEDITRDSLQVRRCAIRAHVCSTA